MGALIGLEREFVQQRSGEREFAGIRTFSLMALLGAAAAHFAEREGIALFLLGYGALALLIIASYVGEVIRQHDEGVTTEVAALLTPLLGAMMIWGAPELGAALGVIIALILAMRPRLHGMARGMTGEDLRAILEFSIITAVVLPLLPNRGLGPFGVLNPFQIWLIVVFVSGIGFLGYVLMKVLGAERGIGLTGILGGLVSSTATTLSFAGRSKQERDLSPLLAQGVLLASAVMFPRVLIWVGAIAPALLRLVVLPIVLMFLADLGIAALLWRRGRPGKSSGQSKVEFTNPLKLRTAVAFGLAFAVVLVVVRAANEFMGSAGVYLASGLAAITDVDSITLSTAQLASRGALDLRVAATAIVLATLVNTAAKGVMAWSLGSAELRRTLAWGFGAVVGIGLAGGVVALRVIP
ncbi:MAG: hypothetical protein A2Z66_02220 [Chloroflexi bacterium RBG_13_66_10]|nr:MAG: hypothetical protein A2Z66_02220 [Chloroflexi bacterium RBG_13_66_10]